jgi:hypothetical protein
LGGIQNEISSFPFINGGLTLHGNNFLCCAVNQTKTNPKPKLLINFEDIQVPVKKILI